MSGYKKGANINDINTIRRLYKTETPEHIARVVLVDVSIVQSFINSFEGKLNKPEKKKKTKVKEAQQAIKDV